MDSVPYAFCEDVLERLPTTKLHTMAYYLSGQWRSAAQQFVEKRRTFYITISKDSEGWFYAIADEMTGGIENVHEESLSIDRRYVEINQISIYSHLGQFNARKLRCSKEEMARRVVPFLTLRMRPDSSLSFMSGYPKEIVLECLDMFRRCFSFGVLHLLYVGPESEEFLALQLKSNPLLRSLLLRRWPHTETIEQLLLTFLKTKRIRVLDIEQPSDIQSPLKVTIRIVKAAVDSWVRDDGEKALVVYGNVGVTSTEIVSIPLPENVTRREEGGEEQGHFCVRWTKENGSSLRCELQFFNDLVVLESSADWSSSPSY
ncbi:hypothetical protein QR680_010317 [Steinernema hermaphroditum]|uniref:F-box domain-containing protein n=1 Tax=Steinernema hermaphroditum TaxID=289476 RepID=A0AA39INJ5_9BILA|nr:hypothetical protein QR680_010317 [Steinernema hermaphroditum]